MWIFFTFYNNGPIENISTSSLGYGYHLFLVAKKLCYSGNTYKQYKYRVIQNCVGWEGWDKAWFIRSTKSSNTYFNFEILKHLQQILAFLINWDTKLLYHVYTSSHVFGSIHLNFIHCCLPKNLRNWVSCKWFFEVRSQWFLEFFSLSLKKVQFNFKVVLDMWLLCCGSWCAELGCPLDMFIVFHA